MKKKIAIYLAGSIQKAHEENDSHWSEQDIGNLKELLSDYEISILNPALRSDDLSDQRSVFGRDMLQVYCCNFVFVDARGRCGLGVGAEMMWAKLNAIPVITLSPKNTHYNKSVTSLLGTRVENWIHPFIESLSDCVAENLAEGASWINTAVNNRSMPIKSIEQIHESMRYYHENQLTYDIPMQEVLMSNIDLSIRIKSINPSS
ncbi:hypothetical protein AQUSIP_10780 [Aquicella siphonis]|uniref:Nucleoside 2-deoxyribosyltransferase n=1 Tax=Aquicella siphonis TaxID=254247 RepID=A0A5E4PHI8_9COXI|nr:hypothetical protein [Aquicella siphonis]VVC75781.1 hypothetical protein AQUSIP_10780 [Aquicella siphonis]